MLCSQWRHRQFPMPKLETESQPWLLPCFYSLLHPIRAQVLWVLPSGYYWVNPFSPHLPGAPYSSWIIASHHTPLQAPTFPFSSNLHAIAQVGFLNLISPCPHLQKNIQPSLPPVPSNSKEQQPAPGRIPSAPTLLCLLPGLSFEVGYEALWAPQPPYSPLSTT